MNGTFPDIVRIRGDLEDKNTSHTGGNASEGGSGAGSLSMEGLRTAC
jgi:hypothetical protein